MYKTGRTECNKPTRSLQKPLPEKLHGARGAMTKEYVEPIFNLVDGCLFVTCHKGAALANCSPIGKVKCMWW